MPKPLVQLARKPLLDHVLDRIAAAGVPRAVVNVHYKADLIEAHLQARQTPPIIISDERGLLLETGGGIKQGIAPARAASRSWCTIPTACGSRASARTCSGCSRHGTKRAWIAC